MLIGVSPATLWPVLAAAGLHTVQECHVRVDRSGPFERRLPALQRSNCRRVGFRFDMRCDLRISWPLSAFLQLPR